MFELTAEQVLATMSFRRAVKTAPTKIRPFTEWDVLSMSSSSFFDLEGREHNVAIGRYLCVGIEGEQWTCSEKSVQTRRAISEPDDEGFRLYVQRDPQPVLATVVNRPFILRINGHTWMSQRGVITWNGQQGDQLVMRVIEMTIFAQTYEFLDENQL